MPEVIVGENAEARVLSITEPPSDVTRIGGLSLDCPTTTLKHAELYKGDDGRFYLAARVDTGRVDWYRIEQKGVTRDA